MGAGRYGGQARFRAADAAKEARSFEEACSFLNYESLPTGPSPASPDDEPDDDEVGS
jgi:hypothetical protein